MYSTDGFERKNKREAEKERERKSSIHWLFPQVSIIANGNQNPGMSTVSPTWMAGARVRETPLGAFLGAFAGF